MAYELRPYQQTAVNDIYEAWQAGNRAVLYLSGTGTGKTVVFSHMMEQHKGASLEISHRKELVDQASITLAKRGVKHSIMAPQANIKLICKEHLRETGKVWYDPNARHHVVSARTMLARKNNPLYKNIFQQATLCVIDECHHALKGNEYGKVISLLPNTKILGVTATSQRTDGQGLGSHHDGFFDTMVEGPPAAWMIGQGYLTPYRIVAPLCKTFDTGLLGDPTRSGDYSRKKHNQVSLNSDIVGDAVESYLRFGQGKIGATFHPSVELSKQQAEDYNAAGIPAAHLDGKTPTHERNRILRQLREGEILQLCNVDLISEGFDLPALEVITICRRTASLIWHLQVSGRVLRTLPGKTHGLIIDHVGNYLDPRLGLPDSPRQWVLDRRDRKKQDRAGVILTKICPACMLVYERFHPACPFCGHKPPVAQRAQPEQVDGDLIELSPEVLQQLGAPAAQLNKTVEEVREEYMQMTGGDRLIANSNAARHREYQELQKELREEIVKWRFQGSGVGFTDAECYRKFFLATGLDVLSAQGLRGKKLREMIKTVKEVLK